MTQVRDEACKRMKSNNYDLKYKNKLVDLSQTFRQTGLPSGATLELVVASRSTGVVSVALQFLGGDGTRMIEKFPSDTTLWRILRKFELAEGKNLNITGRSVAQIENGASGAGRIYYEMPTVNIVGRECSTFGDLQKTLQQLGINNGTALLKLSYKKTEQPLEEAMAEISDYFKEEAIVKVQENPEVAPPRAPEMSSTAEAAAKLSSGEPSSSEEKDTDMTSQDTSQGTSQNPSPYPEHAVDTHLIVTPAKAAAPISPKAEPKLEVYLPPTSDTIQAARTPFNEADFEPTTAHLRSAQSRLLNSSQNTRLPSDEEIARQEQEKAAKLAAMREIQIRIRFPDQHQVLATLHNTDSAAVLYNWVKRAIVQEDQPFKLLWTDKKGRTAPIPCIENKNLVKDLGFSTRELVIFHWEAGASESARKTPALKPELLQNAKELQVPEVSGSNIKENENSTGVNNGKGKETENDGKSKAKKLQGLLMKKFSK